MTIKAAINGYGRGEMTCVAAGKLRHQVQPSRCKSWQSMARN
jgi:hypothetical protein